VIYNNKTQIGSLPSQVDCNQKKVGFKSKEVKATQEQMTVNMDAWLEGTKACAGKMEAKI
jgi:hypothetical protein